MGLYPSQPVHIPLHVPGARLIELLNQRKALGARLPWRFRLHGGAAAPEIHLWCGLPLVPLGPRFIGAVSADETHLTGSIEVGIRPWLLAGALTVIALALIALPSEGPLVAGVLLLMGTLVLPPLLLAIVWTVWHSQQESVAYLSEMLGACAVGAGA